MKQNPVSILVNKGVVMVDHLEANTEGIVEDMELKENTVVMDMVVAKVRQKISLHIFEKDWMPMVVK